MFFGAMHRRMVAFYAMGKPVQRVNRIGRLTMGMLGPDRAPLLKAKAMETHCLVPLMLELLNEHGQLFGRRLVHFKSCVTNLLRFFNTCKKEPRNLSDPGLKTIEKAICAFLASWKRCGGHEVFKHHMAFHVAQRASSLGNPRAYHTFADEEENRVMSQIASRLHGSKTFYLRLLQRVKMDVC